MDMITVRALVNIAFVWVSFERLKLTSFARMMQVLRLLPHLVSAAVINLVNFSHLEYCCTGVCRAICSRLDGAQNNHVIRQNTQLIYL